MFDLPLIDERAHRGDGLHQRRAVVGLVRVEEVDHVHLQPRQRLLALGLNMRGAQAADDLTIPLDIVADFRRDDECVAQAQLLERVTDDPLGGFTLRSGGARVTFILSSHTSDLSEKRASYCGHTEVQP